MDVKETVKLIVSAAIGGLGIGFLIGRREVYDMAVQCDQLIETNKRLQNECDDLATINQNLREANRWKTELMLKEAIVSDYATWQKETEDILTEDAGQIVDEMSDEEYQETLAYIQGDELD